MPHSACAFFAVSESHLSTWYSETRSFTNQTAIKDIIAGHDMGIISDVAATP